MKITNLVVQDFKRVKLVDVAIDGDVITIGGRNAQGKSSLIDALWNAIAGKQRAVEKPIRDGQTRASVEVTIEDEEGGGYVVTRTYTAKGSAIKLTPLGNPGAALSSPQKVLDSIVGKFAFDPLQFAMQDKNKQLATLLDLVDLDFDLPALEAEIKEAREERTFIGREKKTAKGAVDTMGPKPKVEGEPVSLTALADELQVVERLAADRERLLREHATVSAVIEDLEARLEQARAHQAEVKAEGKAITSTLAAKRPADEIRADMESAEERNFAFAELDKWEAAAGTYRAKEREYDELTAKIADLESQKNEGLARANFPIEGLSFDEEGVLYQGVPFSQASAAEKIRVSVAMAMAMNPDLKVICVKDATLLDAENRELLIRLGAEHGFQVFLEMVGASDDWTLVLEDGEVVR